MGNDNYQVEMYKRSTTPNIREARKPGVKNVQEPSRDVHQICHCVENTCCGGEGTAVSPALSAEHGACR